MYDQEANTPTGQETSDGDKGKADAVGHAHGKHHLVYSGFSNGRSFHPWTVGQGGGQRRNLQNDFTRFFYSYRRHDWVPVWYQTHAK